MKIIVVDDDPFICTSLKTILQSDPEIEVAAIGTSGEEAIELYDEIRPDILLMDIQMGKISGLEAGEAIIKKHPEAKALLLTTFSDNEYIVKALQIGAKGYLIKQNADAIIPALKAVMLGQSVFGEEITAKLPSFLSDSKQTSQSNGSHANQPGAESSTTPDSTPYTRYGINEREMEIIEQVAKGQSNKEIADTLHLSEGTVRNYLSVILEKLTLRDRTQLAVFYYTKRNDC